MMEKDPRVDAFIEKSADFARPILIELRSIIHAAHPLLTETWKWSFPTYTYQGKIICSFSAFKHHCTFGFWLAAELKDEHHILEKMGKTAMGSLGKITSLTQLPDREILTAYILESIECSGKTGVNSPEKATKRKVWDQSSIDFPQLFTDKVMESASFDQLSPSQRKEYVTWIDAAKTEVTKTNRINAMLENLKEGKSLHWKYTKK